MKVKKIAASALALTMLFGTGVSTFAGNGIFGGSVAITAQAEDFGDVIIKDDDRFVTSESECRERFIQNEDFEKVYDKNPGIYQWWVKFFDHLPDFRIRGPYKVHDSENNKDYWGYTGLYVGDKPEISSFTDQKGILFEMPEGDDRIPAGLIKTSSKRTPASDEKNPDAYKETINTKLYFGGKVVKFENIYTDDDNITYDDSIVYETDEKTIVLPECTFDAPDSDSVFGGWKFGNKVYREGETVKLADRLSRFEPVWGKPEAVKKVDVTLEAPEIGTQISDKAKAAPNGVRLFTMRTTNVEIRDEDGIHYDPQNVYFENTVSWSENEEDLPIDRSSGALLAKNAEKGKKYQAVFYLQGNEKYKMTADTQVFVNGQKAVLKEEKSMRNTFRCEVEFKPTEPKPQFLNGDVSGDGKIDIEDAVKVISHVNGQQPLTDEESKRANVDGNSTVDIEDAVAIIAHVNGIKSID